MAEVIATPTSGAGQRLVQVLTRIFPQIAGCEAVEIRIAVGEPIRLKLLRAAAVTESVSPDDLEVEELGKSFYLREVSDG